MYPVYLKKFIVSSDTRVNEAYYQMFQNPDRSSFLIVVDHNDKYCGIISKKEFQAVRNIKGSGSMSAIDICNKERTVALEYTGIDDIYNNARLFFWKNEDIDFIPVIDKDSNIIDVMSRERAFYLEYFKQKKLPRMHYAQCIYNAASEAKKLGYKEMSVIEFGTGRGNGLMLLEFHAREIEYLTGINIKLYGFDNASGLPKMTDTDYRNLPFFWKTGMFCLPGEDELKENLFRADLVIGDIANTSKYFLEKYNPPAIGVIIVDVDLYTSTVPILEMLDGDNKYFLPRVYMWFDDLLPYNEFMGEQLGIREFNNNHTNMKISPENMSVMSEYGNIKNGENWDFKGRLKKCHRFDHPKYMINIYSPDTGNMKPDSKIRICRELI